MRSVKNGAVFDIRVKMYEVLYNSTKLKWQNLNVLDIILFFLKDGLNFSVESASIKTQDRS